MPNLTLSNEQVIELVKQLPEAQQQEVYKILILSQWRQLEPVFNEGPIFSRSASFNPVIVLASVDQFLLPLYPVFSISAKLRCPSENRGRFL